MRKRLLSIFVSVLICSAFVACSCANTVTATDNSGNNVTIDDPATIIDSVDDPQPIEIAEPDPEPDPEPVVTVDEPDPEPVVVEPEPDPNEELTMEYLDVDEDWFKDLCGVGVVRDGRLYSLSDMTDPDNFKTIDMGIRVKSDNEVYICSLGDWGNEKMILDDRFVIPVVTGDDDLSWYGDPIESIEIIPMDLYGYTVPIMQNNNKCTNLTVFDNGKKEYEEATVIHNYKDKSTQLVDADGNDVFADFRNLKHGESYILKWNDGVDHEETLEACWRYYKPAGDSIKIPCTSTEDAQIKKVDFSSIPSGTYLLVESYSLVEIKND